MRRVAAAVALLAALVFVPGTALAETYQHGYLEYEVADQSVTITGYAGHEESATVPAMIGGNPVNSVAAGAFAEADTIEAVFLPDTVVSVEQGAFAPGQAVVFAGQTNDVPVGEGGDEAATPSTGGETIGIEVGGGSLVTTDDEGHLVFVDKSGDERVLDDAHTYKRVTRDDGTFAIVDDAGGEVAVADGSTVSFSDAEGEQVVVDTKEGTTTVTGEDGLSSYQEVDIDSGDDGQVPSSEKAVALPVVAGLAAVGAAVAAVVAVVVIRGRRKS